MGQVLPQIDRLAKPGPKTWAFCVWQDPYFLIRSWYQDSLAMINVAVENRHLFLGKSTINGDCPGP